MNIDTYMPDTFLLKLFEPLRRLALLVSRYSADFTVSKAEPMAGSRLGRCGSNCAQKDRR